jgi:hypothetical protein
VRLPRSAAAEPHLLRDGNEETLRASNTSTIFAEVRERSRQLVDLVDHHNIDEPLDHGQPRA